MRKLLWWTGVPTAVVVVGAVWVTVVPSRSGAG
jgi:TM2 domain-containing membrane protein YozV